MQRSPPVGRPTPCARSMPTKSPSRSRATMTWPTISPGVRLRTRRCVPVWQNEQVSVQPTWLETHKRAAIGFRDVDALDLVRPLALMLAGQPQQPLARAVDGNLLGHDLRPRQRVVRVEHRVQLLRHAGHLARSSARRAHRSSARAAAPASSAATAQRRRRRAPRPAPRASARPAKASPAARSARAGSFRARCRFQERRSWSSARSIARV